MEWVTVEKFWSVEEAQMALSFLQSEGIPCQLEGLAVAGNFWHLSNATGGVKLLVAPESASRAAELLGTVHSGGSIETLDTGGLENEGGDDEAESLEPAGEGQGEEGRTEPQFENSVESKIERGILFVLLVSALIGFCVWYSRSKEAAVDARDVRLRQAPTKYSATSARGLKLPGSLV